MAFGGQLISLALVFDDQEVVPVYEASVCANPNSWPVDPVAPVSLAIRGEDSEERRRFRLD